MINLIFYKRFEMSNIKSFDDIFNSDEFGVLNTQNEEDIYKFIIPQNVKTTFSKSLFS